MGAFVLYLPSFKGNPSPQIDWARFGISGLFASIIQTFILLFILLSDRKGVDGILYYIALECRPLLYGFCLFVCSYEGYKVEKLSESNAEIAEKLCITETTVKKHLSNIFAKLQITRREQIRGTFDENE